MTSIRLNHVHTAAPHNNNKNNGSNRSVTSHRLILLISCLLVANSSVVGKLPMTRYSKLSFLSKPPTTANTNLLMRQLLLEQPQVLRGGSTAAVDDDDKEEEGEESNDTNQIEEDDDEDDDEEEDDDESKKVESTPISSQPVTILVSTSLGNVVLDQKTELSPLRTRSLADLKKSISKRLPGKPPILALQLVFGGRVLEDDDMLVDELFDDEEEEDEEDEDESDENNGPTKTLVLNIIPPVEPKFATELNRRLKEESHSDDYLSTADLIDAYYLNQVAMAQNSRLLVDPAASSSSPSSSSSSLLRLEMQAQAKQLQEELHKQTPESVWETSLAPVVSKNHITEEIRGHRYRSGKGGARTNLKKSIQHNFNVDWPVTIRNILLFLFFGYFGGRNSLSRALMLWGAPLSFLLQARPAKLLFKQLFYCMINPPSIVLSLLPAPQQALLSMDIEKSYRTLYQTEGEARKEAAASAAATKKALLKRPDEEEESEDDKEEEIDEDEEEYDEYDEEESSDGESEEDED